MCRMEDVPISHSEITGSRLSPRVKHPMETLLKNGAFSFLKIGDLVEGTVIAKRGTRMFVDLGLVGTGIVYGREYYAASDIVRHMKIGDTISAKVVELDNPEGYIELSLREAGEEKRWADLKKMMETNEILELPVLEANRGGLILEIKGIKGFLPASQLSEKNYPRIEGGDKEKIYHELQKLIGMPLRVKIIGVNPQENKLIFGEKDPEPSPESKALLTQYSVGQEVEGEITSVVDFGAFMKFGPSGLEGLIHISEIDWMLIDHPRDILSAGQNVRAKIIDIQGDKVSFSLKRLKEDPWDHASKNFRKGDVVRGQITRFNPFGAFVLVDMSFSSGEKENMLREEDASDPEKKETGDSGIALTSDAENGKNEEGEKPIVSDLLQKKVQGLVHISEFGTETKMKETVETGKSYDFKILFIDPKEHRLSLGLMRQEA